MPKETGRKFVSSGQWHGRTRGRGGVGGQMIRDIAMRASCILHTNPCYYCLFLQHMFAETGLVLHLNVAQ